MTNMIMIQSSTSARGCDDHLVITAHFKDHLHVAELFMENGRTISGLTTIDPTGNFDSDWERCPGALKGEVVYHKKADIEPRNDRPKAIGEGYCSGYHKTVWAKKNSPTFINQSS